MVPVGIMLLSQQKLLNRIVHKLVGGNFNYVLITERIDTKDNIPMLYSVLK